MVTEDCDGCGYCVQHFECPAIVMAEDESRVAIDSVLCTGCGVCRHVCPKQSIRAKESIPGLSPGEEGGTRRIP